jgi:hypothetical protein
MKKSIFISLALTFIVFCSFLIYVITISFTQIKPTTEAINKKLSQEAFTKTISIPQEIPPPAFDFDKTSYFWEMITLENEVTGIRLTYTTAFSKNENIIKVILEMPENGDPSIFNKVLSVIIIDEKSFNSAQYPHEADLSKNKEAGYKSLKIFVTPDTNQTTKLEWEFEKQNFGEDIRSEYQKIEKYPKPILRILYKIPHSILRIMSS